MFKEREIKEKDKILIDNFNIITSLKKTYNLISQNLLNLNVSFDVNKDLFSEITYINNNNNSNNNLIYKCKEDNINLNQSEQDTNTNINYNNNLNNNYKINILNAEVNEGKTQILNLLKIENNLKNKIEKLKEDNLSIRKKLKESLNDNISLINEINYLKDKINKDVININDIDSKINNLDLINQAKEQQLVLLEDLNKNLKQEIKHKNQHIINLNNKNNSLENFYKNKLDSINIDNYKNFKCDKDIMHLEIDYWKLALIEIVNYFFTGQELLNNLDNINNFNSSYNNNNNLFDSIFKVDLKNKSNLKEEVKFKNILDVKNNNFSELPFNIKDNIDYVVIHIKKKIDENSNKYNKENIKDIIEKDVQIANDLKNEMILRRKIHNRYMLLRGNMRLFIRIRPFIKDIESNSDLKKSFGKFIKFNSDQILVNNYSKLNKCFINNTEEFNTKQFEFDYVFHQRSCQNDIYNEVNLLINGLYSGLNICIFAYGQTCTGKTYTIEGPLVSNPGIVLRSAKDILEYSKYFNKPKNKIEFSLGFTIVEIYNECLFNLLDKENQIHIYEDNNNNLITPGLHPIEVTSFDDVFKLMQLSKKLRKVDNNGFHARSSRSHCIYTFYLKIKSKNSSNVITSKLNIVDLAGSERLSKSNYNENIQKEEVKKEAVSINLSLNALSNVLVALNDKSANHIPYRDSKLTHFLKSSLNDNFNIILYLHISPNVKDINETISTLEFGNRILKFCKHKTGKDKLHLVYSNK